jgi:aerobic-type carbon monoxide dehydrogenase small subunit (CoxS/CutS family)
MIMAVEGLIRSNPSPDEAQIRDYLSGNLCRCGTYSAVIAAVQEVVAELGGTGGAGGAAGSEAAGGGAPAG